MRIGVMLRCLKEKGGVGVYTRNLMKELLDFDRDNEYVLFYRSAADVGFFEPRPNLEEIVVRGWGKAVWDQLAVPWACWKHRVDVVFHPKFSVPLLAPCRTAMVVHGADWLMPDQARFYGRLDVWYQRLALPLYFRKASAVVSVSDLTTNNFLRVLDSARGKIRTIRFAPALAREAAAADCQEPATYVFGSRSGAVARSEQLSPQFRVALRNTVSSAAEEAARRQSDRLRRPDKDGVSAGKSALV